jgi:hypothetical protein
MAKPTYIVNITISKKLKIHVPAESSKQAAAKAVAALKEEIKQGKIDFEIESSCYGIKVDKKKFYVESILIDDHPDIMSVAEYFEDAGFYKIPEDAGYGETLCEWLVKQPSFELDGYDVTLVRVGHLWSAVVRSLSDKPKVPVEQIEEHMANYLASAKKLPNGSKNPVKGSLPVGPGSADDAARLSDDKEVVKF